MRLAAQGSDKQSAKWLVRCDCGKEKQVSIYHVLNGKTQSCGCLQIEASSSYNAQARLTHGKTFSRAYNAFHHMHDRCKNPKYALFYRYGGRGIEVCSEWSSFEKFYSDMGDPFDGASLDRIDNDKGYFRENCRWATAQQKIPTDVVVEKLLGKAKLSLFLFGRRKLVYHTQH